jgi:hypothetical protein
MLNSAGLQQGFRYTEVLLDGFDPVAPTATGIDALPVYKSGEPAQLDAAGIKYGLFDPTAQGIPGTFGLLYTSTQFAGDHPTATADFIRAALKGMEDASPIQRLRWLLTGSSLRATRISSVNGARPSAGLPGRRDRQGQGFASDQVIDPAIRGRGCPPTKLGSSPRHRAPTARTTKVGGRPVRRQRQGHLAGERRWSDQ